MLHFIWVFTVCKSTVKGFPEHLGLKRVNSIAIFIYCSIRSLSEGYRSDFIWDFGKLPFPANLGKYIIKYGKISTKIHEIGKIKTIFGLGMTPI